MKPETSASPAATITGSLGLGSLFSKASPSLRWCIPLIWLASTGVSVLLGIAAVEHEWSALPFQLGEHHFYVTFYPPLILAMFWLFWFGFWWAMIPTWTTTFLLATYYGMSADWAFAFAFADPLGLALIAMLYRAMPNSTQLQRPLNILIFALISFAGAVLSSVGAFIWSHATQTPITELYPVWEGWWMGFWLQNLLIVLPLLLLCDPRVRRWQGKTQLWQQLKPGKQSLRQTLIVALMLVCTALMYTWLSAGLTERALSVAAYSRDAFVWQPIALMARDSLNALVAVLVILMGAMTLFGIYLFRDWSSRLTQSHQQVIRTNRRLKAEIRERKQAQNNLQEGYRMLSLMAELDSRLHAAEHASDVIKALSEYLPRQLPRMEGALCRITPEFSLEILLHWGRHPLISRSQAEALRLDVHTKDWHNPKLFDPEGSLGIARALPIHSDSSPVGVILLGAEPEDDPVVSQVLHTLSEHLSLALTNLRLRERLMDEATHDPLTGLYNRRYLHNWLLTEMERCRRYQRKLSLLLIDIDHFKTLNDNHGHEAGDRALQGLSDHLSSLIRHNDIACRFGGEEIILALPETDQRSAVSKAQRLCEKIRSLQLYSDSGQLLPSLTISIGVAVFPDHANTPAELIRAADRAMYEAKARGRDRVCIAD